jgi:hypothetical protein
LSKIGELAYNPARMATKGSSKELVEAKNKIEQAITLAKQEFAAQLYWDGALIYQKLAQVSGEPIDLHQAIAYFEKSASFGEAMPLEFWTHFGKAYTTLSVSLPDVRLVTKAIACYKQATLLSLASFEGWIGLGKSFKKLYLLSHDPSHYSQACDCFIAAQQLRPQDLDVWLEHVEFMIDASRRKQESAKLEIAIQTCAHARTFFAPSSSLYLEAYSAEALALLGAWTGRTELVQEAERKLGQIAELSQDEEDLLLINQCGKSLFSCRVLQRP